MPPSTAFQQISVALWLLAVTACYDKDTGAEPDVDGDGSPASVDCDA